MSSDHANQVTQRFRLPVRAPLRELVIACLSATVGTLEIVAWAAFNLPAFVAQAGGVLIAVGTGIGIWCLVRIRAMRWTLYITPDSLVIARGARRQQVPWAEITTTKPVGSRLLIYGQHDQPIHTLQLSAGTRGTPYFAELLEAIDQQLAHRRQR